MNSKQIVKLTNRIAFVSVCLLAYWVFIFVSITAFDFKVFRENITEAFYMSIFGIFALLGGAIILNVMLNMTRISESLENRENEGEPSGRSNRKWTYLALAALPIMFLLLYFGDLSSSMKKESVLVETAAQLVAENETSINVLIDYTFDEKINYGAGSVNKLGIQTTGDRIMLYANDALLAEVYDNTYTQKGLIGLFIGAEVTEAFTVKYDYLAYWTNP